MKKKVKIHKIQIYDSIRFFKPRMWIRIGDKTYRLIDVDYVTGIAVVKRTFFTILWFFCVKIYNFVIWKVWRIL